MNRNTATMPAAQGLSCDPKPQHSVRCCASRMQETRAQPTLLRCCGSERGVTLLGLAPKYSIGRRGLEYPH